MAEEISIPKPPAELLDRVQKAQKVMQAIFYHANKHELNNLDLMMILAGAFKTIQRQAHTIDEQTEMEIMFDSMIHQMPEPPTAPPTPQIVTP